jgi:UDP-sugar transporter A1/2/3
MQYRQEPIRRAIPSADVHTMVPFKGFLAVAAACFTSGLAGVYFEMVLKNSTADLWVRNVQLSLFSLLPALVPIIMAPSPSPGAPAHSVPSITHLFANFTPWAWATVLTQVLGGLITALVIKYADNIMKGFATSLSIVISFLASVGLFHFRITSSFVVGAGVVLAATWLYSQPDSKQRLSCMGPFKFLRARRCSNAPPPVSPVPTRSTRRCPARSILTLRLRSAVVLPSALLTHLLRHRRRLLQPVSPLHPCAQ